MINWRMKSNKTKTHELIGRKVTSGSSHNGKIISIAHLGDDPGDPIKQPLVFIVWDKPDSFEQGVYLNIDVHLI